METAISWVDLAESFKHAKNDHARRLRADWFAWKGGEDSGIWILALFKEVPEVTLAEFSLIAAQALSKLGINAIAVPNLVQCKSRWKRYRTSRQLVAMGAATETKGTVVLLKDLAFYVLYEQQSDSIDGFTWTWLDVLRRETRLYADPVAVGRKTLLTAHFQDVYDASAIYCLRRARDEIAQRLITSDGSTDGYGPFSRPPDASPLEEIHVRQRSPRLDKGNLMILRGTDGELKRTVTLDVASRYGGVSRRAIEKAARKGSLDAEGTGPNRRILVRSLLKYYPPEENTN